MNLIVHTLLQEKSRIDYMIAEYEKQIEDLPKGTISQKVSGKNIYYYLKYRNGKKIVSQYIKKDELEIVHNQIERRRHIEGMLKSLQAERVIANKALEGME